MPLEYLSIETSPKRSAWSHGAPPGATKNSRIPPSLVAPRQAGAWEGISGFQKSGTLNMGQSATSSPVSGTSRTRSKRGMKAAKRESNLNNESVSTPAILSMSALPDNADGEAHNAEPQASLKVFAGTLLPVSHAAEQVDADLSGEAARP